MLQKESLGTLHSVFGKSLLSFCFLEKNIVKSLLSHKVTVKFLFFGKKAGQSRF